MPQNGWSDKRERQYEHIKEGLLDRGETEDTAEEIAARTVNKERARAGEAADRQSNVDRRHLVGPARRAALALRRRGTHVPPALRRSAEQGHRGPIEDVEGATRTRRRSAR